MDHGRPCMLTSGTLVGLSLTDSGRLSNYAIGRDRMTTEFEKSHLIGVWSQSGAGLEGQGWRQADCYHSPKHMWQVPKFRQR